MIPQNELAKDIPVQIVGSSTFGRYPKISLEETWNMIISDNFMVDYAGYKNVFGQNSATKLPNPFTTTGVGRGQYHSTLLNQVVVVVGNSVFLVDENLNKRFIFTLDTLSGDVFIAEDVQGHIAVCDKKDIWIYTKATGVAAKATIQVANAVPGYIAFHDGRFITVNLNASQWMLSDPAQGNAVFPSSAQFVGNFQTKADIPLAVVPLPGKANNIMVMGSITGQFWTDVGAALFPYQLSQAINLDYGTLNSDTIAIDKDYVCWLAGSEKSGPFIAYSTGSVPQKISTDGIDFFLSNLTAPTDAHGFFFRQDGHLIYQLTFPTDNISIIYDFNTQKFFQVSDENMNYHPAKRAVYFNETYYFVSLNDANYYEFDTSITTYNYGYNSQSQYVEKEIPRMRITNTMRSPSGANTIWNGLSILFEMGTQPDPGMSVSYITVTDQGSGYTEGEVYLLGGGGQGATAQLNALDNFELLNGTPFLLLDGEEFDLLSDNPSGITTITVTNPGANYAYPPIVSIVGDGTGAGATAHLTTNTLARCDLAISENGGQTFGNDVGLQFNLQGDYKNRFTYFEGMGMSNELTLQLKLWSKGRFVMGDGMVSAYQ